jgi:hypothetical protein
MTDTVPGSPRESLTKHIETSPRFTPKGVGQAVMAQLLANALAHHLR